MYKGKPASVGLYHLCLTQTPNEQSYSSYGSQSTDMGFHASFPIETAGR